MQRCTVNTVCKGTEAVWWYYIDKAFGTGMPCFREIQKAKPLGSTSTPCCEACRLEIIERHKSQREDTEMASVEGTEIPIDLERTAGLLPEGTYLFRIVDYEQREGAAGMYWAYTLEVADGVFEGQKVWANISHAPSIRFKTEEFLDAVGAPTGGQLVGSANLGKFVRGTVEHSEYNGRMKPNIKSWLPARKAGSAVKPTVSTPPPPPPSNGSGEEEETEVEVEQEEAVPIKPKFKKPF